jgi:3-deoxy-D-manno-octulosonic-acid transferase
MYLLYSTLLVAWGLLLLPAFLYKAWRYNKYLPGLAERFGRLPDCVRFDGRECVWFHACSVGETLSLEPLVRILHRRFPEARFLFSTVTKTGRDIAVRNFAEYGNGNVFYFPVDLATVAGRVFNWIRPSMIVIVDTEIWPNLLRQAHRRGIPVVLANGRISPASFRRYRRFRPILGRIFHHYRILMMQSEEDAGRIESMGATGEKIEVTGNIKFDKDLIEKEAGGKLLQSLEEDFQLGRSDTPLIVAGSTHPGEEEILLQVLERIRSAPELGRTRLLLAPRHPERFETVARLAARNGFEIRRRTRRERAAREAPVLLLDTLGELAAVYRYATIVFVGGTLVRHGGHSIVEPALYAKAIVVGPYMENFKRVFDEFHARGGIRQILAGGRDRKAQIQQLLDVFLELLQNEEERLALGSAAYSILEKNRGAAERTGETIAAIFKETRMKTGRCPSGKPDGSLPG